MNPLLASIYGTGFAKTASDDNDTVDLNTITGAQLLAGLESGELELPDYGFEKEAGEGDIDLSSITGAELVELMNELEASEGEGVLNKMASDGSFEEYDMAGRIMAHALHEEMNKLASGGGEVYDLNEITGEQALALLESGEFELVGSDLEKEAGRRWGVSAPHGSSKNTLARQSGQAGNPGDSIMDRLKEMATGHKASERRAAAKIQQHGAFSSKKAKDTYVEDTKKKERWKGYGARAAGTVAGGGGVAGTAALLRRRNKQ
jgi:hypothetical protein